MKVSEILAVYASILSTLVFVWNIIKGTPRIKVDIIHGAGEVDNETKAGVYISVKNPSSYVAHLSCISLLYPYRKYSFLEKLSHSLKYRRITTSYGWVSTGLSNYNINDKCPLTLEPRSSYNVFIQEDIIEGILKDSIERKLKAEVQDQLWRNKTSKVLKY